MQYPSFFLEIYVFPVLINIIELNGKPFPGFRILLHGQAAQKGSASWYKRRRSSASKGLIFYAGERVSGFTGRNFMKNFQVYGLVNMVWEG